MVFFGSFDPYIYPWWTLNYFLAVIAGSHTVRFVFNNYKRLGLAGDAFRGLPEEK
jgi:hypothetical protein